MDYYKTNALYEYIRAHGLTRYRFVSGNTWQLVYGDSHCRPRLLVVAAGVPAAGLYGQPSKEEQEAFDLLQCISEKAGLSLLSIRFATDVTEVASVVVADQLCAYKVCTMLQLSELFSSFGLPVTGTATAKYLNDKTSSAYHHWQRSCLGPDLKVSDIDLWRTGSNGRPHTIYELKRSIEPVAKWKPYKDDYNNFRLLFNLCCKAGLQLKIIYNQRTKQPFHDNIRKIKIFRVDFSKDLPIKEEKEVLLT
jgi:hypothetical protein